MRAASFTTDQRGIALPMAMFALVLLATLMLALATMSGIEPVIAGNHLRATQARALADSGLELARWALSQGAAVAPAACALPCLSRPLPGTPHPVVADVAVPAPAPYDGTTFFPVGLTGGFTVRIVAPAPLTRPHDRDVTAVGWTPTDDVTDARTKAHRRVFATVRALPDLALTAPCALCVRGDLALQSAGTLVDATSGSGCGGGAKMAAYTAGAVSRVGLAELRGQGGTPPWSAEGRDYQSRQSPATFGAFAFSPDDLRQLRELARRHGTYFGPGSPRGTPAATPPYDGSVTFGVSAPLRSGIVFIDTLHGTDPTPSTPAAELAQVTVSTPVDFTGVLVVHGRLDILGDASIKGLVYIADALAYQPTTAGAISGLVISRNLQTPTSTITDTAPAPAGAPRITLDCTHARAPHILPRSFHVVPGTYRDLPN